MLAVSFNVDVNLLLNNVLLWSYDSRELVLFSLDLLRKLDLTLDVSLLDFGGWSLDVAIRRREDAKGNWDAGIEVQIAGCQAQDALLVQDKKRPLASLLGRRGVEDSRDDGLRGSLCSSKSGENGMRFVQVAD